MNSITQDEIKTVLAAHRRWLNGEPDGKQANLYEANLYEANLYEANLYGADLGGADLRGANLRGADLGGANLGSIRILQFGPTGSRHDYLVVKSGPDLDEVMTGCFCGTLAKFEAAVGKTHGDNAHGREYRAIIACVRAIAEVRNG